MRFWRLVSVLLILGCVSRAWASWSVVAVDQNTKEVVIASATCVPQDGFQYVPAKGLMDIQAIVVPGKGVAAAQANMVRTRRNQDPIFRELGKGASPEEILKQLQQDPLIESRQYGIVDLQGRSATFTGRGNPPESAHFSGQVPGESIYFAVQGNILADRDVVNKAVEALKQTRGSLTDRVMAAMEAGDRNGGDRRCTCDSPPKKGAPCETKTAHVAYILKAEAGDANGDSFNDGTYSLYISVTNEDIQSHEDANPVKTLRMRYDQHMKQDR